MKALVYGGPRKVEVKNVPDPRIERPTDVLVRITTTNVCGSDLHMYEGRTSVEKGKVLGHENLGEVIEVGDAVYRVRLGDRVCLPFNIACGCCRNCEKGFTGFCLTQILETLARSTATRRWDRIKEDKPSSFAFRSQTSTACACPRTPSTKKTTT